MFLTHQRNTCPIIAIFHFPIALLVRDVVGFGKVLGSCQLCLFPMTSLGKRCINTVSTNIPTCSSSFFSILVNNGFISNPPFLASTLFFVLKVCRETSLFVTFGDVLIHLLPREPLFRHPSPLLFETAFPPLPHFQSHTSNLAHFCPPGNAPAPPRQHTCARKEANL